MKYLPLIFLLLQIIYCSAQKPSLDTSDFKRWSYVSRPVISSSGTFISYTVENQPFSGNTLYVKRVSDTIGQGFINGRELVFSSDEKLAIFKIRDSLVILTLGTGKQEIVPGIAGYKYCSGLGHEWVLYSLKSPHKNLIIRDLGTGETRSFPNVSEYYLNERSRYVVFHSVTRDNDSIVNELSFINLLSGYVRTMWINKDLGSEKPILTNLVFSPDMNGMAWLTQKTRRECLYNSIWYGDIQTVNPVKLIEDPLPEKDSLLQLSNYLEFSKNSKWVYFRIKPKEVKAKQKASSVHVDIWNYKDLFLPSDQKNNPRYETNLEMLDAINIKGGKAIPITQGIEEIAQAGNTEHFILDTSYSNTTQWWRHTSIRYYLFSLSDKSKKLLITGFSALFSFSPHDRFVIYFDGAQRSYFSYDLVNGKTYNISKGISGSLVNEYLHNTSAGVVLPVGIAGWIEDDSFLFLYDNYDIWKVSPTGSTSPVNITSMYGRVHHTKIRIIDAPGGKGAFRKGEPMILTAFDASNKSNGLYLYRPSEKFDPKKLKMAPCILRFDDKYGSQTPTTSLHNYDIGMIPAKAHNKESWIVRRMTATEAPNYFITNDFIHYSPLSKIQPQLKFNWLSTKLITWKQYDGTYSQGILYRPENFNDKMKYPLIINYYEQLSFDLNAFLPPRYSQDEINIPYYVSRGYLVFVPDVRFSIADISNKVNGENTYNSVVSAATYLAKKPWVDSLRIGINGHSFAGFETNYLITHTHFFAAAAESSGTSDFVSTYLSLSGPLGSPQGSRQHYTEMGQGRMGANLWQRKDLYLRNSPVLRADQVTTPLLIMHNSGDFAVPWGQGVEFFLALQRLGKKVWMLQYDRGQHSVFGEDAKDYTARLAQFFDYYLKGTTPPVWMTKGIPARMKGIEDGLAPDSSGKIY